MLRDLAVSVVLVNFNGRHHLERCLPALGQTRHVPLEVIVVDNGSSDDSLQWLDASFPQVRVLAQGDNLGFGEANRRGIARDGGGHAATDFWWEWDAEEQPFLAEDRPWERADIVACGTPALAGVEYDAANELIVGPSLRP